MPKGFYSQGVCILLSDPITLDRIEEALSEFDVVGRQVGGDDELIDAPSILLAFRPEVDRQVLVSLMDCPWPGHVVSTWPKSYAHSLCLRPIILN